MLVFFAGFLCGVLLSSAAVLFLFAWAYTLLFFPLGIEYARRHQNE